MGRLIAFASLACLAIAGAAPTAQDIVLPNNEKSVRFAVIGDSGTGGSAQIRVAERLEGARKLFPFTFTLMLGDNLYGSERPDDFVDKFEQYREYAAKGSPAAGPENFTIMPWLEFSQLDSADLGAIYTFLRSQKPIYNIVDSHPGVHKMISQK